MALNLEIPELATGMVASVGHPADAPTPPPAPPPFAPMNHRHLTSALLLVLLAPVCLALALDLRVEPDASNVTAGRLEGLWESDSAVAERMGLKPDTSTLEFLPGAEFLAQIPAKFVEALAEFHLYESGTLISRAEGKVQWSRPYLLTIIHGNPHVLMFRARDGDPLGDVESANVFVAPGKEHANDLLLLGGDFSNQPFRPYRRVIPGELGATEDK